MITPNTPNPDWQQKRKKSYLRSIAIFVTAKGKPEPNNAPSPDQNLPMTNLTRLHQLSKPLTSSDQGRGGSNNRRRKRHRPPTPRQPKPRLRPIQSTQRFEQSPPQDNHRRKRHWPPTPRGPKPRLRPIQFNRRSAFVRQCRREHANRLRPPHYGRIMDRSVN